MTSGQVTTPVFLLGGLIPGSVLLLCQSSPPARGAPESSPGVVLCGGASFTALGEVDCFHELRSLLVAAWRAAGLPAPAWPPKGLPASARSEERRVGKERRSCWS